MSLHTSPSVSRGYVPKITHSGHGRRTTPSVPRESWFTAVPRARPVSVIDDGGEISMSCYSDEEAIGYRVYRWDGTSYVPVHSVDHGGRVSWADPAAPRGTTSFYRVTAVLADGTESAPAGAALALLP